MSVEIIGIDIVKNVGDAQKIFYDQNFRTVAGDILFLMKTRVHKDGLNSAGSSFTPYSKGYMRTRQCNNRGTDTKKIMSLTRELENSYGLIRNGKGWAIGIITGAGEGGKVGFKVSCIEKKNKNPKKKSKFSLVRKPLEKGKERKTISNAQKIEYLEKTHGVFMTAMSAKEKEYFDDRIQEAWNAALENKTL